MKKFILKLGETRFLLAFSLVYLVFSFFLANFVLAFFQSVIKVVKELKTNKDALDTFQISFDNAFIFQDDIMPFYWAFYAILLFGLIRFWFNMKMNFKNLKENQHGSSEFENSKELLKQYKKIPGSKVSYKGESGVIISAIQQNDFLTKMSLWIQSGFKASFKTLVKYWLLLDIGAVHTLIIGITRSGKGETHVFPQIDAISRAEIKDSMLVNDPKGELAAASYDILIERGYDVHIFNLLQPHMSMGYDPLVLVKEAYKSGNLSLAQQYAHSIAFSMYNDPSAKDPFWNNSAMSLVKALILAITADSLKVGREERINLYSVANFLMTKGSDTNEETGDNALDLFFKARPDTDPARMSYATSNFAAGNARASIFATASAKLEVFTSTPIAKMTSYNSMDLTELGFGDKPVAVFMIVPDFDKSNNAINAMFVSQAYRVNAEKASLSTSGRMKRNVRVLLDEFGNMASIDGLPGMITVGAGRGFRFHLVIQAYSQVKALYGEEEADTIIGNCSNQIYILTNDNDTAKEFSDLVGNTTINEYSRSGQLLSTDKSYTESTKERQLIYPSELMQLKVGESVIVRVNKRQDNDFNKIVPKPIYNKEETAAKARYEYLADDFDNSKSALNLPVISHHDIIRLEDLIFLAKSDADMYVKMIDVMPRQQFLDTKARIREILGSSVFDGAIQALDVIEDYFDDFSFLQYYSFLVNASGLEKKEIVMFIGELSEFLPEHVIKRWRQNAKRIRILQVDKEEIVEQTKDNMYAINAVKSGSVGVPIVALTPEELTPTMPPEPYNSSVEVQESESPISEETSSSFVPIISNNADQEIFIPLNTNSDTDQSVFVPID